MLSFSLSLSSVARRLGGSVLAGAGRGGGGRSLPPSVHHPAHMGTTQAQGVSDRPTGEVEPAHPGFITRCKRELCGGLDQLKLECSLE